MEQLPHGEVDMGPQTWHRDVNACEDLHTLLKIFKNSLVPTEEEVLLEKERKSNTEFSG